MGARVVHRLVLWSEGGVRATDETGGAETRADGSGLRSVGQRPEGALTSRIILCGDVVADRLILRRRKS